jgi:hypothetical protein
LNLLFEFLKSTPLFSSNLIIAHFLFGRLFRINEAFSLTSMLSEKV